MLKMSLNVDPETTDWPSFKPKSMIIHVYYKCSVWSVNNMVLFLNKVEPLKTMSCINKQHNFTDNYNIDEIIQFPLKTGHVWTLIMKVNCYHNKYRSYKLW